MDKNHEEIIAKLKKEIEELRLKKAELELAELERQNENIVDVDARGFEEKLAERRRAILDELSLINEKSGITPKKAPPRPKVETLSRTEINTALDALKNMRNEQGYSGGIPRGEEIMCYARAQPAYYEWDKVPSKYTCLTCGKAFGGAGENARIRDWNLPKDKLYIDASGFDRLIEIPKSIIDLGYDAKIDFNCLECVKNGKPPFVKSVKIDSEKDYTVSYYKEQYAVSKEYYPDGFDYFDKKDYSQAIGFLRTLKNKSIQTKIVFELEKQSGGLYRINPCELIRLKKEWGADFAPYEFLGDIKIRREKKEIPKKSEEETLIDFMCGGAYEKAEIIWGKNNHSDKLKHLSFFTNLKDNFTVSFYVDFELPSLQSAARVWNDGKPWEVAANILKNILGIEVSDK
ncbi:MAG: hypothetical protein FWE03_01295 [Firmicutes bacterium]|nr:hypothetical protein [Bacillota bacterium]